ncbi:hypothetical protein JTB14_011688 [Gonioctena quinquepunctata]|nr:hypothetical protein JTB14_011688 [Gonioctena quinquepunctata]
MEQLCNMEKKLKLKENQVMNLKNIKWDWNPITSGFSYSLPTEEPIPTTSQNDEGFKIPNKRSKTVSEMDTSDPIVELNKFQVLAETEPMKIMEKALDQQEETVKSVEKPQPIQIMDQNISPTNKPPPIFIRDRKSWPTTCQYLD